MNIEQVKDILNDPGNWIKHRYQSGLNSYDVHEFDVDKAAREICELFDAEDEKTVKIAKSNAIGLGLIPPEIKPEVKP